MRPTRGPPALARGATDRPACVGSWLWKEGANGSFRVSDPGDECSVDECSVDAADRGPGPPTEKTPEDCAKETLGARLLRCGCVPICDARAKEATIRV